MATDVAKYREVSLFQWSSVTLESTGEPPKMADHRSFTEKYE